MENIKLNNKQLYSLADLIIRAKIEEIAFNSNESSRLFNLSNPAIHLTDYTWNVREGFISGKINNEAVIYPPKMLLKEFIEDHRWHQEGALIAALDFVGSTLTSEVLLDIIQKKIHKDFEYLSLGQARAIIKRKLRLSLTSGERNDITRLRRKIEGYQKLIGAFETMLDKKSDDSELYFTPRNLELNNNAFLEQIQSKLQFFCFECKTSKEFPNVSEAVVHPKCHGKTMTINWGTHLSAAEASDARNELEVAVKIGYEGLEKVDDFRKLKTSEKEEIQELITGSLDITSILLNNNDLKPEVKEFVSELIEAYHSIEIEKISRSNFLSKINNAGYNKSIKRKLFSAKVDGENHEIAPQLDLLLKNIKFIDYVLSGVKAGFTPSLEAKRLKPIPKDDQKIVENDPQYFCTICKNLFEIPKEKRDEMVYSTQDLILPSHCGKEMEIRIVEHPVDTDK